MYKRIHGNFVHFAPPPIRQVSGKLAHCVRSNSASNLPAMLTKWTKLPTECLLYMAGLFLLYWYIAKKIQYLSVMSPCYLLFYAIEAGKSSVFLNLE